MLKNYILPLIFICFAFSLGYGQMSDLIISEYAEGSSNNKYVEIYNGTGTPVNLANYEIWRISNGGTWPEATISLSGTLANGDVYIIANGSSSATILASADLTNGVVSWNGDDAVGLAKDISGTFTLIDAVGTDGADPGTGWDVAGTNNATANRTLVRKSSICDPNINWSTSAGTNTTDSEWTVYASDTWTYLGSHTETCSATNTIVQFLSSSSILTEDGLFIDVCVGITNASTTAATTVDIELDASSTATNGTDYDDGAGTPTAIAFPQTLTFPADSSADECFTIFISNDDSVIESDETIVLNLNNATGGDSASISGITTHTVTIEDNDYYDSCLTSLTIPVNNSCVNQSFTNVSATDSGIADPGCGAYAGGDAWFNLVVPSSGAVTVESSNNGGITDSGLALYTGTCGSLTLIECDNDDGDGNMSMISSSGLTPGSTIYVRIWEYNNNDFDTFSLCAYSANEIDVERANGNSIANGSTANTGNDTVFAATEIGTATPPVKSYFIRNEGSADLNVTSISSSNTAEFSISTNPAPATLAPGDVVQFDIEFSPINSGTRTGTITIVSDDSDENPYTFGVQGEGVCASLSGSISPTEGPAGTTVTIVSSGNDLTGATASLNGEPLTSVSDSALELVVRLPNTITSGGPLSIQLSNGCTFSNTFNLIDNTIAGCQTTSSTVVGDLFISEITDSPTGSLSYIELYNGTGSPVDFSTTNYSVRIYNNGNTTTFNDIILNSGSVANGDTYVISCGTNDSQCPVTGGDGSLAQVDLATIGASINFFASGNQNIGHDFIGLYDASATLLDAWGTFGDETWAIGLGLGDKGANFQRDTNATFPNTTFSTADWIIIDWTDIDCSDVDYSTIGAYDYSTGTPPTITIQPTDVPFDCTFSASYTIAGAEGYDGTSPSDTQELAYQWFYNAPGTSTWTEITAGDTDYSGQQSATLTIPDTSNFNGYQYYCQLREDTTTCFTASNAVKLEALSSIWDGSSWSTPPSIDRAIIIDGDYDTADGTDGQTSFSGCSLIVNTGYTLQVSNNTYIEIENDIIADGDITVFTAGAVVQNNDLATVTANGTITVQKETSVISTQYQYTYWSSPVVGETVENVFSTVPVSRRFVFNAANFVDELIENANTNTFITGQDDIDDDGNDWQAASGTMLPGVGYAATASTLGFLPAQQQFPFLGAFNNGIITPAVVHVAGSLYADWNFIGNPYPSAIDTNEFFTVNSGVVNTIYLWSHATPENINASGNEGANFAQSDYAIISGSGVNTAGGSGVTPDNFVPSGQGFFIETLNSSPVTFNNAMRVTGNNDQFFRSETTETSRKVLWLNLSSDNGVAKQIAVAHLEGATDNNDGSFYDVTENKSSALAATFYSTISDSSDEQFVIQGKHINSLDIDEIIPLGFKTTIDVATLYTISIAQFEGDFYTNNDIYIKDDLLNTTHNLKTSDYTFTSEPGEFNNRFEIVFTTQALSIDDITIDANGISIIEVNDNNVQFKLNSKELSMTNIEILDVLGRRIYNLQANSATEVYNLSKLSQAAYIARITLSNGQVISKKAVKR